MSCENDASQKTGERTSRFDPFRAYRRFELFLFGGVPQESCTDYMSTEARRWAEETGRVQMPRQEGPTVIEVMLLDEFRGKLLGVLNQIAEQKRNSQ